MQPGDTSVVVYRDYQKSSTWYSPLAWELESEEWEVTTLPNGVREVDRID